MFLCRKRGTGGLSSFCAPDKNDTPVLPPYQLIWVRIVTVALLSYVIWGTVFNFSEAELPYIKIGIIMTQNEVIRRVKTYTYWIFFWLQVMNLDS